MSTSDITFWDAVDRIRQADARYRPEAYRFVVAALGSIVQSLPEDRLSDPERRHLSGRELLRGVILLAHEEFGSLAPTVFREWGVTSGEDVGRIVFQLVDSGQLSARPEDTMQDFMGLPDLMAALEKPADSGEARN